MITSTHLAYLQAMDIQTWRLKNKDVVLLFITEKSTTDVTGLEGRLLDAMLQTIGLADNTTQIISFSSTLKNQIAFLQPQLIVAWNELIARDLLSLATSVARQTIYNYQEIPFIISYSPAHLLRSPGDKRAAFQDLQLMQTILQKSKNAL